MTHASESLPITHTPATKEHVPFREDKQLTGTALRQPARAPGTRAVCRDDLEALGYLWLYFFQGKLPAVMCWF